jgi:hypothetical protein
VSGVEPESPGLSTGVKVVFTLLLPLVALTFGFIVSEIGLHWLAESYLGRGKLFEPDPVAGWRTLPKLDLIRRNSNGDSWRIVTDDRGFREVAAWRTDATRRLLVLGDSLAFGEGTNIEHRFDSLVAERHPDLSVINAGTMGYGTFQQIVLARPFFDDLQAGDTLLLLTCSNDFIDMLRPAFTGRSKPLFRVSESGAAIEEFPGVDLVAWARDKSYIASRLIAFFGRDAAFDPPSERDGLLRYEALVRQDLLPLARRGVRILLAYYDFSGHPPTNQHLIEATFERLCLERGVECLTLNEAVDRDKTKSPHLLRDGHWNPRGNRAVANLLLPLF